MACGREYGEPRLSTRSPRPDHEFDIPVLATAPAKDIRRQHQRGGADSGMVRRCRVVYGFLRARDGWITYFDAPAAAQGPARAQILPSMEASIRWE